jgi:hypothetical protein
MRVGAGLKDAGGHVSVTQSSAGGSSTCPGIGAEPSGRTIANQFEGLAILMTTRSVNFWIGERYADHGPERSTSVSYGVFSVATWRKRSNMASYRLTDSERRTPWCSQAEPTAQLAQQNFRPAMMCGAVVYGEWQRMQRCGSFVIASSSWPSFPREGFVVRTPQGGADIVNREALSRKQVRVRLRAGAR